MVLPIADIQARLVAHEPVRFPIRSDTRQAAVAVVLRERNGHTEVLFIQRAVKAGDPWSGDMAFPGGHREPADASLAAAAIRETAEEIGLAIGPADMIGELPQQRPSRQSGRFDLLVAPYVFAIEGDPSFELNYEVADVVWTRLAPMHTGANRATERKSIGGRPIPFPGYRLGERHFVWGMTYRMVQTLFEVLDPDFVRSD